MLDRRERDAIPRGHVPRLVSREALAVGDYDTIAKGAEQFVTAVANARRAGATRCS